MDRVISYAAAFGQFWYNFIIGDDWTLAATAALGIAVDLALHYAFGFNATWYILPALVLGALGFSVFHNPFKN